MQGTHHSLSDELAIEQVDSAGGCQLEAARYHLKRLVKTAGKHTIQRLGQFGQDSGEGRGISLG